MFDMRSVWYSSPLMPCRAPASARWSSCMPQPKALCAASRCHSSRPSSVHLKSFPKTVLLVSPSCHGQLCGSWMGYSDDRKCMPESNFNEGCHYSVMCGQGVRSQGSPMSRLASSCSEPTCQQSLGSAGSPLPRALSHVAGLAASVGRLISEVSGKPLVCS